MSSPMVLYAKDLGASATVLGILAGMMPILVIFQIPAAKHVERVGYKRFIYAGWGTRVAFIIGMALVPFSGGFLDKTTQLVLLLMLLFGFNLSRGISSCAWLPWMTSLIPSELRGRYLLRDAAFLNVSSFAVFLIAAFSLGSRPQSWQFAMLFAFSAVMGATSLVFIKRIPEPAKAEHIRTSSQLVPWREIAAYPPFRKLLRMNFAWSLAYGGLNTFVVAFLKTEAGLSERNIMLVSSTTFLGGLCSLWFLGSRLDRLGSKPVLTFSMLAWICILAGWVCLSGKLIAPVLGVFVALQFLMGLTASLVTLSNTRLAMAIIPPMGRSHFFALFSVVASLTLGLSPIFWGLSIDAARTVHRVWHGFEWNRFSLFFAAVALMFSVTLWLCRRLDEPQAASMETLLRDILEQSPLRFWLRFWPRG
ncbi:MAG: MFS transporter [Verrucomicrobiota bacterium]